MTPSVFRLRRKSTSLEREAMGASSTARIRDGKPVPYGVDRKSVLKTGEGDLSRFLLR